MNAPQPAANASAAPPKKGIPVGLIAGVVALVVVLLLPLPASLPPAESPRSSLASVFGPPAPDATIASAAGLRS